MRRIVISALFLPLFAFLSCSKPIERSMVVGKYIANHQKGDDIIELKPDGTYLYHYKGVDGKEVRNTNRWEFEYCEDKPTITFSEFVFGLPGYGFTKSGFWVVKVKKSLTGNLRLCIDPDLNYYYEKSK